MKKLIGEMKGKYDFVVFDGAPILAVTDSVVLSTLLDGVVLMARFNVTRTSGIKHSRWNTCAGSARRSWERS